MAIRYDKKLNNEIDRTIRNFNAKIRRLEKLNRDLVLPEKIKKKDFTENIENRRDLKYKLKDIQKFSQRGMEEAVELKDGYYISKYEIELLKNQKRRLSKRLSYEIKKLSFTKVEVGGREQDVTFAQMGDDHLNNLKARKKLLDKNVYELDKKGFDYLKDKIIKTQKHLNYNDYVFKDNYLQMLLNEAYFYGYDQKKIEEIRDKISKLSTKDFLDLFNKDMAIKMVTDFSTTDLAKLQKRQELNPNYFIEAMNQVHDLYDMLYENIDDILKKYNRG